jgi:hypothetical protein
MAGAMKKTRFLDDDELLAEIDALSDNDVSNSDSESESFVSESESESESCAEGIGDGDENDLHQDAAQCTKRRQTSSPLFQWQRGILFHRCMNSTMKIQVFRPTWMKIAQFLMFSNFFFFFHSKLCNT